MTPEQLVSILVAIGTLLGAIGGLAVQIQALRKQVDGRLTELLAATESAAAKDGELKGRDFTRRATDVAQHKP